MLSAPYYVSAEGSLRHPGILIPAIRNIWFFLYLYHMVFPLPRMLISSMPGKLLLILQDPVTYALLWKAFSESPNCTELAYAHTKLSY